MAFTQDYSIKLFTDLYANSKKLKFKSILHGNLYMNEMNFNNFILSYTNMIDCVLKKYADDIKQGNQGKKFSKIKEKFFV